MKKYLAFAVTLLAAGCTYTYGDNLGDTKFYSPFKYTEWTVWRTTTPDGSEACMLDAGRSAIRVTFSNNGVAVDSNRSMDPGTTLTVTVGGHRFETSSTSFSASDSAAMVESMKTGDKAYMEWSEVHGNGVSRVRVQEIALLYHFAAQAGECERLLHGK